MNKLKQALAWTFLPGKKGYPGLLYIPGFVVIFIFMTPWLLVWIPYSAWKRQRDLKKLKSQADKILSLLDSFSKETQEEKRGSEIKRVIDLMEDEHNSN